MTIQNQRVELVLALEPLIAKKAKENIVAGAKAGGESPAKGCQKSDKASIDTKKELAKTARVSHDTIHKGKVIAKPIIDLEFKSLIPPLSSVEHAQLESNILANGVREPLVTWRGILLDGHNRLEICTRHRLPYRTVVIDLPDRDAARMWMIHNQLGRRSVTPYQRAVLALQLEPVIAAKAKEHRRTHNSNGHAITTRIELARIAGISDRTLGKVKTIEREGSAALRDRIRRGHLSIEAAYQGLRASGNVSRCDSDVVEILPSTGRRIAYADPPYPGMARRFYSHDPLCAEVDHAELVRRLDAEYDSWALSTSSTTLRQVLAVCPTDVRIAAWVKPFCPFRRGVNPQYAWEAVIFKTPNRTSHPQTVKDFIAAPIAMKTGLVGAKPEPFCFWLFELLGAQPGDELHDLYPGTGAVTRAWQKWRRMQEKAIDNGEAKDTLTQSKCSRAVGTSRERGRNLSEQARR